MIPGETKISDIDMAFAQLLAANADDAFESSFSHRNKPADNPATVPNQAIPRKVAAEIAPITAQPAKRKIRRVRFASNTAKSSTPKDSPLRLDDFGKRFRDDDQDDLPAAPKKKRPSERHSASPKTPEANTPSSKPVSLSSQPKVALSQAPLIINRGTFSASPTIAADVGIPHPKSKSSNDETAIAPSTASPTKSGDTSSSSLRKAPEGAKIPDMQFGLDQEFLSIAPEIQNAGEALILHHLLEVPVSDSSLQNASAPNNNCAPSTAQPLQIMPKNEPIAHSIQEIKKTSVATEPKKSLPKPEPKDQKLVQRVVELLRDIKTNLQGLSRNAAPGKQNREYASNFLRKMFENAKEGFELGHKRLYLMSSQLGKDPEISDENSVFLYLFSDGATCTKLSVSF